MAEQMTKGDNETQTEFTIRLIRAEAWAEGVRYAWDDEAAYDLNANPYATPTPRTPESADERGA